MLILCFILVFNIIKLWYYVYNFFFVLFSYSNNFNNTVSTKWNFKSKFVLLSLLFIVRKELEIR